VAGHAGSRPTLFAGAPTGAAIASPTAPTRESVLAWPGKGAGKRGGALAGSLSAGGGKRADAIQLFHQTDHPTGQRCILVTNYDMLPASRYIRDLVGYIRYHNPGEDVVHSTVISVFDLLYRAYSQRLLPLAARLRRELKYPSEDIIWTVLHDITAELRYAHMTVSPQVLLRNLLPDLSRLTPAQRAYVQHRASVDFVVYNQVTNQPLLAIEVDGFAFHENSPDQRARDALKDEILEVHQMPLLRLPTTGSQEHQQIRQALDNAEAHWALLSTR